MGIEQPAQVGEHGRRRSLDRVKGIELFDLAQGQPEFLQPLDEAQALQLVGAVDTAPGHPAANAGQQPQFLVIPDGPGGQANQRTDFSDGQIVLRIHSLPVHVNCILHSEAHRRIRDATTCPRGAVGPLDPPSRA